MRTLVWAALAAVSMGSVAEAAVYRYVNTGAVMASSEPEVDGQLTGGEIVIDESLYLGGSIAGSTLTMVIKDGWDAGTPESNVDSITVSAGGNTYSHAIPYVPADSDPFPPTPDWTAFGIMAYLFPTAGRPVALNNTFRITFGPDGMVQSLFGSVTEGGSNDYTFSGGTWTRELISGPPAVIPLPASAPLLLLGAGMLWGLRRGRAA